MDHPLNMHKKSRYDENSVLMDDDFYLSMIELITFFSHDRKDNQQNN